jgi:hypothetical protein
MPHYHVTRHGDDDDPYITDDIYAALDYAATELAELADMEGQHVDEVANRVAEIPESRHMPEDDPRNVSEWEMEQALRAWARSAKYDNLHANAANMYKQHTAEDAERAPLYQSTGFTDADRRSPLYESAVHVWYEINENSPISIWECNQGSYTDKEEAMRCAADGGMEDASV